MALDSRIAVSIVIVNWNTSELLAQCLQSIHENPGRMACEVIVVDNASSDDSVEKVRTGFPWVQLIAHDKNAGFAAANNLALPLAKGRLFLFLNPDTVVSPGMIDALADFLDAHDDVGIVGPLLVGSNGATQISSFGLFPSPLEAAVHALRIWRIAPRSNLARRFLVEPDESSDWVYTQHLLGACLMVRRELLDEIGGFDDNFFLFLEETDLCYRASMAGSRLAYLTSVQLVHLGEQSMQNILHKSGGLYIRSYNRFCKKHRMPFHHLVAVNFFLVFGVLTETIIGLLKYRSGKRAFSSLKSLWYGYVASPTP